MNKPTKKQVVNPMLEYNDVINFIENKYKIKLRNYHETYSKDNDDWKPYMDFWHWLLDQWGGIDNPSSQYMSIDEWLEDEETPNWIKEILNMIKTEFQSDMDDGGLEVWISW